MPFFLDLGFQASLFLCQLTFSFGFLVAEILAKAMVNLDALKRDDRSAKVDVCNLSIDANLAAISTTFAAYQALSVAHFASGACSQVASASALGLILGAGLVLAFCVLWSHFAQPTWSIFRTVAVPNAMSLAMMGLSQLYLLLLTVAAHSGKV